MHRIPALLLVFFLTILFAGCTGHQPGTAASTPAQGGTVTLPAAECAAGERTLIVEPEDGRMAVLETITGAHHNITLTIYELNDPAIVDALIAAQERGVQVRVLYNNASFAAMHMANPNTGAVLNLSNAGARTKPASPVFAVTHQKTLTADATRSVIMTFNLEPGYFNTTRDFGIVTTNRSEVREIASVFEADWNYRNVTPDYPTLVWSPVNSREKILTVINHSVKSIDVYNEEITDWQSINALAAAAERGVVVRVIAADMESDGKNVNAPAIRTLRNASAEAKEITSLYIHAKVVLADYGTPEQVAFVGSENLAPVSLNDNRELGILVTEQPILDRLESVFLQDWLVPGIPV